MSGYGVVLFHGSSAAMRGEAVLRRADVPARLVPTPRELTSDCGLALRFDAVDRERVEALLNAARVDIAGIHLLAGKARGGAATR